MISINDVQEFLESVFNFIFVMLSITTFLFLYSEKKKKLRSLIDKEVLEEMNTPLAKFYDKIHYLITLVPFVLPIIYYNTNLLSLNFVLIWVCISPWLWCAVSFTNFSGLIHHALRVVDEVK